MNGQGVKQSLHRLQAVKTWQLIILLILVGFISATFLRLNNVGMVERRKAVITADEAGDDKVTQARLYELQTYVSSHMNTDMGKGVYLEASYKRAVQRAYDAVSSDNNPYGNIYKKAQDYCAPRYTHYSYAYLQCTMTQLEKYPANNLADSVNLPPTTLYLHAYASPFWSPDFAGWTVVVSLAILAIILARFISILALKFLLRRRYKSI